MRENIKVENVLGTYVCINGVESSSGAYILMPVLYCFYFSLLLAQLGFDFANRLL
jgi:hypothetical protein